MKERLNGGKGRNKGWGQVGGDGGEGCKQDEWDIAQEREGKGCDSIMTSKNKSLSSLPSSLISSVIVLVLWKVHTYIHTLSSLLFTLYGIQKIRRHV